MHIKHYIMLTLTTYLHTCVLFKQYLHHTPPSPPEQGAVVVCVDREFFFLVPPFPLFPHGLLLTVAFMGGHELYCTTLPPLNPSGTALFHTNANTSSIKTYHTAEIMNTGDGLKRWLSTGGPWSVSGPLNRPVRPTAGYSGRQQTQCLLKQLHLYVSIKYVGDRVAPCSWYKLYQNPGGDVAMQKYRNASVKKDKKVEWLGIHRAPLKLQLSVNHTPTAHPRFLSLLVSLS